MYLFVLYWLVLIIINNSCFAKQLFWGVSCDPCMPGNSWLITSVSISSATSMYECWNWPQQKMMSLARVSFHSTVAHVTCNVSQVKVISWIHSTIQLLLWMVADNNVVVPTGILVETDTTYRTNYKCNSVRFNTLHILPGLSLVYWCLFTAVFI